MNIIVGLLVLDWIYRIISSWKTAVEMDDYREEHKQDCEFAFGCINYGKCKGCMHYGIKNEVFMY